MDDNDADRYLRQANACLEEAQRATRVADKEAWLKLSEEWMAWRRKRSGKALMSIETVKDAAGSHCSGDH
ncbi:hypothetical protein [Bradyrhizobium shewense]|uniref:hypothetical protein n=1 Tax=Bradyrhizobium shewense TaxID=1761772 RepID=UPI00101AD893|nr:hypothetical protein [Bradyrhizobium shewense]